VPLSLYRRHRKECEASQPEECRSGEFEERKKGWRKCACFIFASGTLGSTFKRRYTGKTDWDEAKAITSAWEEADSWDGEAKPVVEAAPLSSPARISIADGTRIFLNSRQGAKIAEPTLRKYRTFTNQLTAFAESRGYIMLDQLSSADIDIFYDGLNLGARAKGTRLGTLRAFFRFCMNRKWLNENPVPADIKPPIGANRVANKIPFTDEELHRIVDACDRIARSH
jgi:hypothetical protein